MLKQSLVCLTLCAHFVVILVTSISNAHAQSAKSYGSAIDAYEIVDSYTTSNEGGSGSSGSSNGKNVYLERVIAVRNEGLELEYDLPADASEEERARYWQFPARVFKPTVGPLQLLNRDDLDQRLDGWLEAAKWERSVCGSWIFTWNAFKVECDPNTVLLLIDKISLRSFELNEGATYTDAIALAPGHLHRTAGSTLNQVFVAQLNVNPDVVKLQQAESDVAVGEIIQKPVTMAEALNKRQLEEVTGSISVTLEGNKAGQVWKRTKVTTLKILAPDGTLESRVATEVTERHPLSVSVKSH